jgi:hypothetical protein
MEECQSIDGMFPKRYRTFCGLWREFTLLELAKSSLADEKKSWLRSQGALSRGGPAGMLLGYVSPSPLIASFETPILTSTYRSLSSVAWYMRTLPHERDQIL